MTQHSHRADRKGKLHPEENTMKLNPPKQSTFYITLVLAAVGVIIYIVHLFARSIPYLQPIAFLLVLVAYGLLCLSLIMKGV